MFTSRNQNHVTWFAQIILTADFGTGLPSTHSRTQNERFFVLPKVHKVKKGKVAQKSYLEKKTKARVWSGLEFRESNNFYNFEHSVFMSLKLLVIFNVAHLKLSRRIPFPEKSH